MLQDMISSKPTTLVISNTTRLHNKTTTTTTISSKTTTGSTMLITSSNSSSSMMVIKNHKVTIIDKIFILKNSAQFEAAERSACFLRALVSMSPPAGSTL